MFPDGPCPGWQEDLGMGSAATMSAVFPAKSKVWPKSWADVPEVIPESRTKSVSRARGEWGQCSQGCGHRATPLSTVGCDSP